MIIIIFLFIQIVLTSYVFYKLAIKYGKNKLIYSVIGAVLPIIGVLAYVLIYMCFSNYLFRINRYMHELLSLLLGVLFSVVFYFFMKQPSTINNKI